MTNLTMGQRLTLAGLALSNAADVEVAPLLAAHGYTIERLAEGQALLTAARQALSRRQELRGVQRERSRQFQEARRAARQKYIALATVARRLFKDRPGLLVQLGIQGATPDSFAALLQAGVTLLDNLADPAIAAELAEYGHTAERIAEIAAAFQTLKQANDAHEAAKGDTQQATRDLQAAMSALDNWISRFRTVARDALRDYPDFLEKLGILARS
jgi:hypothetical protein